jgi:hypothetical protein
MAIKCHKITLKQAQIVIVFAAICSIVGMYALLFVLVSF